MVIDIVIRCERGDMVIRFENIGYENFVFFCSWVGLFVLLLGIGCLVFVCGFDLECFGRVFFFIGCFFVWNSMGIA